MGLQVIGPVWSGLRAPLTHVVAERALLFIGEKHHHVGAGGHCAFATQRDPKPDIVLWHSHDELNLLILWHVPHIERCLVQRFHFRRSHVLSESKRFLSMIAAHDDRRGHQ